MAAPTVPAQGPSTDTTQRVPGDMLLGLVPLAAIAVLVLNDHLLKAAWPGALTGKLSDVAGLVFFPFVLVGMWQLGGPRLGRPAAGGFISAVVAICATGIVFALVKTTTGAGDLYRGGLALLQWPFAAVASVLVGDPVPAIGRVALVADPSDLVALPALAVPLGIAILARPPDATAWHRWRGLAVSVLACGMLVGAVVDGWAHTHLPAALETVLTPWHAVVYTSFALLVAVFVGEAATTARTHPAPPPPRTVSSEMSRASSLIAPGYGPTVIGAIIFAIAGLADTTWHVAFGLEADAEALVSPTHLLLGVGAALIAVGPARSAWRARVPVRWPEFLPVALAVGTIIGLVGFATHIASPYVDAWPSYPYDAASSTFWPIAPLGIAAVGLQSVIVASGIVSVLRLWPGAPVGALAVVILVGVGPLTFLHDEVRLLVGPLAGGLAAELLAATGRARRWSDVRLVRTVAAVTPAAMWIGVVVALAATGAVAWSAHLLGGALVVAVSMGGLIGALATLPAPSAPAD